MEIGDKNSSQTYAHTSPAHEKANKKSGSVDLFTDRLYTFIAMDLFTIKYHWHNCEGWGGLPYVQKSVPRTKNRMPDEIGSGSAGASAFPSPAFWGREGRYVEMQEKMYEDAQMERELNNR